MIPPLLALALLLVILLIGVFAACCAATDKDPMNKLRAGVIAFGIFAALAVALVPKFL